MTRAQAARLKTRFIETFALMGNITKACEAIGISRRVIYQWQEKDEAFSLAYHEANAIATEHLEAEAWRRAVEGVEKVSANGTPYTDRSDTLLIFLLKARKPAMYRDRVDLHHSGAGGRNPADVEYVNDWRHLEDASIE